MLILNNTILDIFMFETEVIRHNKLYILVKITVLKRKLFIIL